MISVSLRIKIAKWLDEYLGRMLIALVRSLRLGRRGANEQAAPARILVIKFWGLGSIILLEPTLRRLRERFPSARLDFLTLTQNREVFALLPHVQRVHVLDFHHPLRFILNTVKSILHLRQQRYDLIFDAEFFANFSALLARLAAPQKLVGFSREHGHKRELLDSAVPFHDDEHAAKNFLRLITLDSSCNALRHSNKTMPRLQLAAHTHERIAGSYIVMNVNASPLALERRWPRENFVSLARWLLHRYEIRLMLIGNTAERNHTQQIAAALDDSKRVLNLAGTLSLRALAGLIHNAALFISNDSGPLHLAAALQKPVVGFYGPETPKRFGPLCERQLIFYLGLSCSPCMSVDNAKTVNCTNQLRCLRELRVLDVISPLQRFITQHELLPLRAARSEVEVTPQLGVSPYAV
ncbi:glycosyltransferase family 9 protein [candidate division KSB1 bacterium]|nr:glycosyltransferase family 9 protein [candidate division KSB1 bacterium]